MSRQLVHRQFLQEGYYHIFNRGNNKNKIFHDHADYLYFLNLLERYLVEHTRIRPRWSNTHFVDQIRLLSFCLMPNHFHLLLKQLPDHAFSSFVQCLILTYTKYYNKKYNHIGHVFQGVFKARLIEDSADLLSTSRYVHNNPKDITQNWIDHPYSSAIFYVRPEVTGPAWLDRTEIYSLLEEGFGIAKKHVPSAYEKYLKM